MPAPIYKTTQRISASYLFTRTSHGFVRILNVSSRFSCLSLAVSTALTLVCFVGEIRRDQNKSHTGPSGLVASQITLPSFPFLLVLVLILSTCRNLWRILRGWHLDRVNVVVALGAVFEYDSLLCVSRRFTFLSCSVCKYSMPISAKA